MAINLKMDRWRGQVAVVTGASAGIGVAIVEGLLDAGLKVVGLARRQERLDELAQKVKNRKGTFYSFKTDVTVEDDIVEAFKWIKKNVGPVHILINNAGCGRFTTLIDGDAKLWQEVYNTNVLGLSIATREAIRDMRANNVDGHVIHVNSIAGHAVHQIPQYNFYPASKYSVTALTESLRFELNEIDSKIKVTSLSPGLVTSEFYEATTVGSGMTELPPYQKALKANAPSLDGKDIADAVMYVLGTPPHVQIHELMIKPVGEKV